MPRESGCCAARPWRILLVADAPARFSRQAPRQVASGRLYYECKRRQGGGRMAGRTGFLPRPPRALPPLPGSARASSDMDPSSIVAFFIGLGLAGFAGLALLEKLIPIIPSYA